MNMSDGYIYNGIHVVRYEEENMTFQIEDEKEYLRGLSRYWREVAESDGFDVEGILAPQGSTGLLIYDCPYRLLVQSYARVGLHRYNFLEGTSFELHSLIKFNMLMNCVSSYYITLLARDPVSRSLQTFLVRVDEHQFGCLDLKVSIARLRDDKATRATTEEKPFLPHGDAATVVDGVPDWPSDDSFNDRNRFHVVERSEFEDNDWIHLYLEVAFLSDDRWASEDDLSQLQIEKVAIEETKEYVESPNQRLNAIVYIKYKDFGKARVGEPVDRKAIVRRVIDERNGNLTFKGELFPRRRYLTSKEMASLDINTDLDWVNKYAKSPS